MLSATLSVAAELRGWGGRIRTSVWRNQNPLPYRLATPQSAAGPERPAESGRTIVRAPKRRNGLDCDFAPSPKGRAAALSELGGNKTVICGCSRGRATAAALFERGSKDAFFQTPCRPLPCIATSLGSSRRRQPGPKRIRTKMSNRKNPALRRGKTAVIADACARRRAATARLRRTNLRRFRDAPVECVSWRRESKTDG